MQLRPFSPTTASATRPVPFGARAAAALLALVAAIVLGAFSLVERSSGSEPTLPGFLEHALGARDVAAPLVRKPAPDVRVAIDATGYRVTRGDMTISLAGVEAGSQPWERSEHGVSRATPFGFETITVDGEKTEQYLTVTERQGAKTWRWKLQTGDLIPRVGQDGAVGFVDGRRVTETFIAPVALFDANGNEITPRGAEWSVRSEGSSRWLELRVDDSKLSLPYVIDPAITYRDGSSTANAVAGLTLVLVTPAAVTENDVLIAQVTARSTTTTFTPPSGWTLIRKETVGSGASALGQALYYRVVTAVEPPTHTWTFADAVDASGAIVAYSGVRTAAPIDASSGGSGLGGTTPTAPSVTTTKTETMLVAAFGLNGTAAGFTPPTGMTTRTFVAGPGTSSATADEPRPTVGASGARALAAPVGGTWVAQLVALSPPDTTPPSAPVLSLSEAPASAAQHVGGSTLYYNPAAFNSGSFAVDATTTDDDSGVQKVAFPGLTAGFTPTTAADDSASPYTQTYSWSWGATESGAKTVTAYDSAGNTSTSTFGIAQDSTGPTGHSIALTGGPVFTNGSVPLTLNNGSDTGGSGVDPAFVSIGRDSAPLVNGACGSFSGTWFGIALSGSADTGVSPGYCYRYRYMVSDNVGNRSSWSAPSADAIVVNNGVGFSSASSAGAAAATSITLSKPADARLNDLLLAQVTVNSNTTTNTAPAGWTLVRRDNAGSGANQLGQAIYWKLTGASEPASYTWTFGGTFDASGGIVGERGTLPSSPIDVSGGLGGSGTTVTAPSVTTTSSGDRLVAFFGSGSSTAFTPPSGMTERYDRGGGQTSASTADQNQSAAGASGTRAATAISAASSSPNIGQLVALRKDATAPAVPTVSMSESSANAFVAGSTLYYHPAGTGSFTVSASSSDAESGLQAITLPGLSGGFTPSNETAATTRTYTWTSGATESGAKTVTAYDNAGNTSTASFIMTPDAAAPSGGSVSYPDGLDSDGVVTITTSNGSDSGAGIDVASAVLERQTAPYSGACGAFSAWSAVTSPDTVPAATCANYRYRISDNVGNEVVYGSLNTVRVAGDATSPSDPVLTLSETPASSTQHVDGTTLYYNPSGLNSGTFTVAAATDDAESGIARVSFPVLWDLTGGGDDDASPYEALYGWTSASLTSGSQTVTARNGAGGTADATFTLTPDTAAPAVAISAPLATAVIRNGAAVSADATDLLAGTGSAEFRYCAGAVCTWAAATLIGTDAAAPYSLAWNGQPADGTYTLLARATDNVGNVGESLPVVVTIDNTAPASALTAIEGARADLQHFDASAGSYYYNPAAAGDFRLENAASDATSGVKEVRFPAIGVEGFSGTAKVDNLPLPYDSAAYGFDAANLAAPPRQTVVVVDRAGNTTNDTVSFVRDVAPPTGGSVVYPDGYDADGQVTVATAGGSDADAGIEPASGVLERQAAALADGVCGAFGSWEQATSPDTVASGTCARYRYSVSDRVANGVTYVSANVVRVDHSAPSLGSVTLSESEPDEHVSGTTLFYNPSGANVGTFTASAAPADPESAIARVDFPAVFGLDAATDAAAPYEASYSWSATSTASGANAVVATNGAGLTAGASFAVTPDAAAPTVSIAAPANGAIREGATISATESDALSGTARVEFRFCPGSTCNWTEATAIATDTSAPYALPWNGQPVEGTYTVVAKATDNVGNVAESLPVIVIVDNTPPIATQNDPGSPLAGVVELPATASDAGSGADAVTYEISPAGLEQWSPIGADSIAPYSLAWNTTTVADGRYDMRIRVTDNAGNATISIPIRGRQVANLPPIVSISEPADFYVNGDAPDPFTITASSPETDLTQVEFFRCSDGTTSCSTGTWVSLGIDTAAPYSASWPLDADGNRALKAVATNAVGTTGTDVNNVVLDRTAPTGGSVTYADGYDADGSVSVATASGTDAISGVDLASGGVERQTAPLALGACGAYGDWLPANVVPDEVPDASCARYRFRVSDEAGNPAVYASPNVVKVDRTAPSVASAIPSELAGAGEQHFDAAAQTLYFRPSGSGSFTLAATVSDAQSGGASAAFPDLASRAGWAGAGGTVSVPYESPTYSWSPGAESPGTLTITGANAAGLTATAAITIAADSALPSGGSVSYADGYDGDGSINVSTIDGLDTGAGIDTASRVVERRTTVLEDGVCAAFAATWATVSSPDTLSSGACAEYRFRVSDRVGNERVYTSANVAKVDLSPPSAVMNDPGAYLVGTVSLGATASDESSGIASLTYQASLAGANDWVDIGSSWDTTAAPDGLYDLRVVAADRAGNVTASALVAARRVDNHAPAVSIDLSGGVVSASSPAPFPLTVTSTDEDVVGVELFACTDQSVACETGSWTSLGTGSVLPYTAALDVGPDGNRAVRAVAVDVAGNAAAVVANLSIDRTPVAVELTASHGLSTASADNTVEVTVSGVTESGTGLDGFSYAWTSDATTSPDTLKDAEEATAAFASPALPDGAWYLHLRAVDNAGNWSDAVHVGPFLIDTAAPAGVAVGGSALAVPFQLRTSFPVSWSAAEAGALFDVASRAAPYNSGFGSSAVWQAGTSATSASFTASPGSTVCFSARARDSVANTSGWSAEKCTAVPLNNTSLAHSANWARKTAAGYYLNTYSVSSRLGASLTRTGMVAKRLALVATRCPTCGMVGIYWKGKLVKKVSLAATTTRKKQLITLTSFASAQTGTFKIVVLSSTRPVIVEGVAVSQ